MSDELRGALSEYVRESLDLRFAGDLPPQQSSPQQILEALLEVRKRLDRLEELLGRAIRLRARAHRASTAATAVFEDAWDQAAQRGRNAPVARGGEFSSARERHADANLAVLDERLVARNSAELAHVCDEAVDVIRLSHRGLDGYRQDLLAILRALQFESVMER